MSPDGGHLEATTDAVPGREVAAHLNASREQADRIVRAGLIPPLLSGLDPRGFRARKYARSALDEFLRRLAHGSEEMRSEEDGTNTIAMAAHIAGCTAPSVVRSLLDGRFRWVGRMAGVRGYDAIRVRLNEVKELAFAADPTIPLSPVEVGERAGLSGARVRALIDAGVIEAKGTSDRFGRISRLVTRVEADRFRETYVSLRQIGREWRMEPRDCRRRLAEHGVLPEISIPGTYHVNLYLRAKIQHHAPSEGGRARRGTRHARSRVE